MKKKIIPLLSFILILTLLIPTTLTKAQRLNYSDIGKHWARGEILEVSALGYMEGSGGKFYPNRHLTYGELLTVAIRALGLEGQAQVLEPTNHLRGVYQLAYDIGLIEGDMEQLRPNPSAKVTREEAANILGRALGEVPPLGHEIREAKKFKDYNRIAQHRLPYVELVLQKGYMKGRNATTLDPKGYITRAEFAKILSNANDDLIHHRGISKKTGQVSNLELGNMTIYNTDGTSNIIGYEGENLFPVQKDKKIYPSTEIKDLDFISYYIDSAGRCLYAEVNTQKDTIIEGTIREIDLENREIVVWDFNDKLHKFKLDPYINMDQLYFEQEVALTLKGDLVTKITTFDYIDPERDGYIIPGTRFRVGTVLFVNNDEIEIVSKAGREKFQIDPMYTTIYKRGQRLELFQVKEGDRVLLSFDDIYSPQVSEIKVEDEEKHIAGVMKGKIQLVDERNKEVLISEPERLYQGRWLPSNKSSERIKLGTGSIYEGGRKISLKDLNKRMGEEAYIAYENSYGNTSISKMLLKSGSAMEHKDKIQDIDYGLGRLVVDTNSFNLHEGTIVIKNNRLVDPLNLDLNQNVYLVSDLRSGIRGASLISIEDTGIIDDRIDGTRLLVYKGKIEDISDYRLTIGRFNYRMDKQVLTSSGFKSNRESEEFTLTLDTLIYDSQLEQLIPTKAFLDSRYIDLTDIKDRNLRNRIERGYYKNKPAYIIVKETAYGKEVLALNLIPQDLNRYNQTLTLDHSTLGEIGEVNIDQKTLSLTKVRNYNNLTNRWDYSQDQTLSLDKAVILVNDKPLTLEELYKLRKGSQAYIVKHNDSSIDIPYIILIEN